MYDVQRDGGRCEPLHQAAGFRLGVSDEESVRGPAQYSGLKLAVRQHGWQRGKVLVPIGMRTLLFLRCFPTSRMRKFVQYNKWG